MKHVTTIFRKEDDGAVTVDWVVLTAAMVGLAAGATTATMTGVQNAAEKVTTAVSENSSE